MHVCCAELLCVLTPREMMWLIGWRASISPQWITSQISYYFQHSNVAVLRKNVAYLLGILVMIKCSICYYQCRN